MKFSVNNRLILEEYIKEGLKAKVMGGIATPGQRDGLKGLKVLVDARLPDGRMVPKGSLAYIKEEALFNQPWVTKTLSCDAIQGRFMVVELVHVEFFDVIDEPVSRHPALHTVLT